MISLSTHRAVAARHDPTSAAVRARDKDRQTARVTDFNRFGLIIRHYLDAHDQRRIEPLAITVTGFAYHLVLVFPAFGGIIVFLTVGTLFA
jgi:hypothetical protein